MALSQVVDVEVNPADVAGVRIRYKLGTAEFSIALSALYQLLLLNPHQGCAILSGLREYERSRRLTDTWAANTPYWAALGKLGWEGCSDEDILMSICGMNPPTPASPRSAFPAKPAPRQETQTPCRAPPPNPRKARSTHRCASPSNWAAARRKTRRFTVPMGRGSGSRRSKSGARSPPPWRGMSHLTPCLVSRCLCHTPVVSTRGL